MAVEATEALDRQIVSITWDTSVVNGDVVKLYCVNPANGDTSQSGLSKNDGEGFVSYPQGYSGTSEITVVDERGNSDTGVIHVEAGSVETDDDAEPTHPIVIPEPPTTEPPEGAHPEHPIALPPLGIWGDIELPDNTLPGDLPIPTHPIVLPPDEPGVPTTPPDGAFPGDPGYNPPPGGNVPAPVKKR